MGGGDLLHECIYLVEMVGGERLNDNLCQLYMGFLTVSSVSYTQTSSSRVADPDMVIFVL